MKKSYFARAVLTGLLCVLTLFGLGGCKKPLGNIESGGVIDKTDYNAPKTIVSKEITGFHTTFTLTQVGENNEETKRFTFDIKENESGVLTAYAEESAIRYPADAALLTALQGIIDEQALAQYNGVYRVTAGLPPEFQECNLMVQYASGETLTFTKNSEPRLEWTRAIYDVFADWFTEKGLTMSEE